MSNTATVAGVARSGQAERVTHCYGLFSATQGLPVSHVVLGTSETSVSSFKDSLLGIGRLAATVNSAASSSGVFSFQLSSRVFVGMQLEQSPSFFVMLSVDESCYSELLLKCMQICHVVDMIYADFLKVLGTRIERDLAAVMNSASFAGSGEDQDCDTCYEERFSVLEDHYIRPLLSIPRVNALYASPIFNCTQIQSLLKKQRDSCSIPQFPYSFGLYKLYSNEADDIEIPLVETECDHTLHFDHCGVFRSLLRFYRAVHLESRGNMNHTSPVPIGDDDLASLLNGTMILHLDGKSTRNGKSEMEAAVIVSSTHKNGMFVAMVVPSTWLDQTVLASHSHVLARVPCNPPVRLPEAGISLLPLESLGIDSPLLECWTALLSRIVLYFPSRVPPASSSDGLTKGSIELKANDTCDDKVDDDSIEGFCVPSVDQVSSLLFPSAPPPNSLGALHPQPPITLRSDTSGPLTDRPKSRPTPNIKNNDTTHVPTLN